MYNSLGKLFHALTISTIEPVDAQRYSATQPFLVSSRNAPPGKERCVTTLKTAVKQTSSKVDDGDTIKSFCSKYNVDEKYAINWAASRHAQFIK